MTMERWVFLSVIFMSMTGFVGPLFVMAYLLVDMPVLYSIFILFHSVFYSWVLVYAMKFLAEVLEEHERKRFEPPPTSNPNKPRASKPGVI